jgi:hypothetical protein
LNAFRIISALIVTCWKGPGKNRREVGGSDGLFSFCCTNLSSFHQQVLQSTPFSVGVFSSLIISSVFSVEGLTRVDALILGIYSFLCSVFWAGNVVQCLALGWILALKSPVLLLFPLQDFDVANIRS